MDTNTATPASPYSHIDPDDRVLTFAEWCELNRISPATGRRIIASGAGPVVTRLSERRIGITAGANRRWRDARSGSAA
jgi:predicted site-specific integrase-resolvase